MHDRPTAVELLDAVRGFIENELVPALEGTRKFHARVAANLMAVLAREWRTEEQQLAGEWERLSRLLSGAESRPDSRDRMGTGIRRLTKDLCARIHAGEADGGPWRAAVLEHVRQTVRDKLAVANPDMLKETAGPLEPR